MGKFLFGLILGLIFFPAGLLWYFLSGRAPVATASPPLPMERHLAMLALHAAARREAPQSVPLKNDEATLVAGAQVYRGNCAVCHGLPGRPATPIAQGMFPRPPQLFEPKEMVTDDPPGETFWKAKNGIRLTGMPGFHASLSDEQLWQVSLLLAGADKLPASVQQELTPHSSAPTAKPDQAR